MAELHGLDPTRRTFDELLRVFAEVEARDSEKTLILYMDTAPKLDPVSKSTLMQASGLGVEALSRTWRTGARSWSRRPRKQRT